MIHCVVLTYLEEYAARSIRNVNQQTVQPASKTLLIDSSRPSTLQRLPDLLEHLEGWQVVVRESGSHFGDHRNSVLGLVPVDAWIVMLDDDEVVHEDFVLGCSRAIESVEGGIDAVMLPRLNSFGDFDAPPVVDWVRPSGVNYPDWQARLFRNNGRIRFSGAVHEVLAGFSARIGLEAPSVTLLHHKTPGMQERSNQMWTALEHTQAVDTTTSPDVTELRSYSQCGEDVFIYELLRNVGQFCAPNMIEMGAGDPIDLSNSRLFIELGWRALLVEANDVLIGRLQAEYAGNSNVVVQRTLISDKVGDEEFHISRLHWALSGVGGVSQAERHGPGDIVVTRLPSTPAASILDEWATMVGQVGLLAIDLEGLDLTVLRQIFAQSRTRPDLILVEALTDDDREQQRGLLTSQGYLFVRNLALSNLWVRGDLPLANEVVALGSRLSWTPHP